MTTAAGSTSALATGLPWFLVLNAAFCLGLAEAVTAETIAHLTRTRLEHLDQSLAQQVVPRLDLARMRIDTDRTRAFLDDTAAALEAGRADAMLRVLEVKAVAAEAAIDGHRPGHEGVRRGRLPQGDWASSAASATPGRPG